MNNYFLDQNIQNVFYTLYEYWIKNYPNAILIIGKQTTITDNNRTHTVIRPKKTTTRRERIGSKIDKYLQKLSYGRQLKLYGHLGEIIEDMKLMKKTTSEIQAEILGIIRLDVSRSKQKKENLLRPYGAYFEGFKSQSPMSSELQSLLLQPDFGTTSPWEVMDSEEEQKEEEKEFEDQEFTYQNLITENLNIKTLNFQTQQNLNLENLEIETPNFQTQHNQND
ncbi:hypothetical protein G9A89_000120 [Geosiphon pyriformis]|nr:hypothetical protein G9A89_000120 [Geosiphon pyriformis]